MSQPKNFISDSDFEKNIGLANKSNNFISDDEFEKNIGISDKPMSFGDAAKIAGNNLVGGVKAAGRGAMEGALDLGRGVEQLYLKGGEKIGLLPEGTEKKYREETNKAKKKYSEIDYIKEHPIASTLGEIGGGVAVTLPLGAATLPLKAAQAAKAGGGFLSKAASAATSNPVRMIGTGAMQGATVGGLEFDPTGDSRLGHLATGAAIGAAIPGGFLASRGAVRMTKNALSNETNVNKKLYDASENMINTLGGEEKTAELMGREIKDITRTIRGNEAKKVDALYEQAKNAPGGDAILPSENLVQTYGKVLDDFVDVKLSPGIKRTIDELASGEKVLNVNEANKLIKQLNYASGSASNKADKMAIGILKDKVYQSLDSIAEDAANPAKELFQMARDARRKMGDVFDQKDIVETITKKKAAYTDYINPEQVVDKIQSPTDWGKIEKAFKFDGSAAGEQAWNNLRTTKLDQLFEKSTDYINGQPQLSLEKLTKNYKKMGESVMRKITGNNEVFNDFNTLLKVMDYWKNKAPGTAGYSNGANLIAKLGGKGVETLEKIPGVRYVLSPLLSIYKQAAYKNWAKANLEAGNIHMPKISKKTGQNENKTTMSNITGNLPRAATISATRPSPQEEAELY